MKLTPWFPAEVKPVHQGTYEVDDDDGIPGSWYAYWDGWKFGYRHYDPEIAFRLRDRHTDCNHMTKWRGLAKPPKKAKAE